MDVCWYNNYMKSKTQVHKLPLLLWFDLNPGIYLVFSYNVNIYNIVIVYLYNNNLTLVKLPYCRGESLNTAHMYTKYFHKSYFVFILVWVGRTVAFSPSYPYCHIA